MVRLEIKDRRGIKGILIDGYMPDFSFLKEIDWKKAKDDRLSSDFTYTWSADSDFNSTYERYLKEENPFPTLQMQRIIYDSLIRSMRERFCPEPEKNKNMCAFKLFPEKGTKSLQHIARFYKGKVHATKEWRCVPVFYEEIEQDKVQGKSNYGVSMLLLNQGPSMKCKAFEECQQNWIDFLGFNIKDEIAYKDFMRYRQAAKALLQNWIDTAVKYAWFQ